MGSWQVGVVRRRLPLDGFVTDAGAAPASTGQGAGALFQSRYAHQGRIPCKPCAPSDFRSTKMLQITRSFAIVGAVVLVGSLAACGHNRSAPAYPNNPAGTEYGRVSNIEVLQGRSQGQTSGAGAVIGAVVGGVLGNQIGKGSGRAAATGVGIVGGAVAGNAIEGRNNSQEVQGYSLSVQLDHGGYRVYDVSSPGDLRIGDRVRLYNGQISRL